jgi:hypothetical protein
MADRSDTEAKMTLSRKLMAALGASTLALPAMAAAQPYYGQPNDRGYPSDYERLRGDFSRGRQARFGGYPEFRDVEAHIRREIQDNVQENLIEPDDARDLMAQLRDIQGRELREFRVHGWGLPQDDRARIHSDLDRLDRLVDHIRDEG